MNPRADLRRGESAAIHGRRFRFIPGLFRAADV
jgi:hypothetical protein